MKPLSNKEKYRSLCRDEESIPLFSRDWWLDTVCGERWDVLLYEEKACIRAAFPFYMPIPNVITMPPMTQTMGVWFAPEAEDMKYTSVLSRRQAVCQYFIERINARAFYQNFNYRITDWLPFYWNGFSQTTRYTYVLENISDRDSILNNMAPNIRRNISRAKEKYRIGIVRDIPVDELVRMITLSFDRRHLKAMHIPVLRKIVAAAKDRNQGDIWGGYDEDGNLHAAAFVVWQESSAWYIAGGGSPDFRHSGAHALVLSRAIEDVSEYTGTFDFEGSMLNGVERFFREFGGRQMPYMNIHKGKTGIIDRARIKLSRLRD
jgi:hypothetical protein